jgi:hypothetical protein
MEPITETKNIPGERWQEFCETFTNGNRGRLVNIIVIIEDVGERLAEATIFSAIDYDPVGKGDQILISYGGSTPVAYHTIPTPIEIWQAQDENGRVIALEIVDLNEDRTLLTFN